MPNVVLYRKYRPQKFAEVVGQQYIVQTLKNAVAADLISHAYIFAGPRGSGKTTLARILAKAVNCESADKKTGEPDNSCSSCEEINRGGAIDLIEIDAASNRGIDEMRDLKEGVRFAPTKLKYKVFVIDEAHQLTKEAANALLKTLEEPPSHAIFIMATTELHKMIPTIISRCQRFDFRTLSVQEIVQQLEDITKKEKGNVDRHALEIIASHAGGSLRDAISLLDKVLTFQKGGNEKEKITAETLRDFLGIVDTNAISEFIVALAKKDAKEAIVLLHNNLKTGVDPNEFANAIVEYIRHILIVKVNPSVKESLAGEYTPEQIKVIQEQTAQFEFPELMHMAESFMTAQSKMKYASIVQLPLELAIADTCYGISNSSLNSSAL